MFGSASKDVFGFHCDFLVMKSQNKKLIFVFLQVYCTRILPRTKKLNVFCFSNHIHFVVLIANHQTNEKYFLVVASLLLNRENAKSTRVFGLLYFKAKK